MIQLKAEGTPGKSTDFRQSRMFSNLFCNVIRVQQKAGITQWLRALPLELGGPIFKLWLCHFLFGGILPKSCELFSLFEFYFPCL